MVDVAPLQFLFITTAFRLNCVCFGLVIKDALNADVQQSRWAFLLKKLLNEKLCDPNEVTNQPNHNASQSRALSHERDIVSRDGHGYCLERPETGGGARGIRGRSMLESF